MSLDKSKLESLCEKGDKWTARCPACGEKGGDNRGEHLVLYPDGKFGCVAHQGDPTHNKRIWRLAGDHSQRSGSPSFPIPPRVNIRISPHRYWSGQEDGGAD